MTLRKCLSSFQQRFYRHTGEDAQARKLFAEFVGVSGSATSKWLRGGVLPAGDKRWRVVMFFQLLGYQVTEYLAWNDVYRQAAGMLAHKLVTAEELADTFGFSGKDAVGSMNKVFYGKKNHSQKKFQELEQFVSEGSERLSTAEVAFETRFAHLRYVDMSDEVEPDEIKSDSSSEAGQFLQTGLFMQMTPEDAAAQLALLVQLALPYAQFLNSEACTPEHRDLLRELAGRNGIFRLNNQLTPLCGERMRKQMEG